jgi:hypothetical protein
LSKFDPTTETITSFKGYNASYKAMDFAFVPEEVLGIYGLGAILSHDGPDAKLWIASSGDLQDMTGESGGNWGRAGWRPGGGYGFVANYTSGTFWFTTGITTWDYIFGLAGVGNGTFDIVWRPDGKRALMPGTAWNSTLNILEHRPKSDAFVKSSPDLIKQPLTGWEQSPYFAKSGSGTAALAGAFRPGVLCDQGLLVGNLNALGYGVIVLFQDTDAHDCPP